MQPQLIDFQDPQRYYSLFYIAAFLVCFFILIAEGRKQNFPTAPWLIVILTGYIFFVFGCRMVTFSQEDWKNILNNQPLEHATGLVMLGGLLFSVPAIFAAKRIVNLKVNVLDAYAFVLPVGMCLQRIGCFLNGCCFGRCTTGWGIQYGQQTSAFKQQYIEAAIPITATHSLSLHPVQLYESLGCLLAVGLLWTMRNRLKSAGSLFLLSGVTYYIVRFIAEFFREEKAYAIRITSWLELNAIQWILLVIIFISFIIILLRERKPIAKSDYQEIYSVKIQYIFYYLAISIVFFFSSKWLTLNEILVVYIALFSTGGYILVELFKSVTVPEFRIASLLLMFLSLVMMSQTYPEYATSDSTKISYNTISIGGMLGSQILTNEDCSGSEEYTHKYKLAAIGVSRTIQTAESKSFTFGLNAYTGTDDESATGDVSSDRPELRTYGFNPFIQFDQRRFGVGAGVHLGDMSFIGEPQYATSIKRYSVYPQLHFRFGSLKRVFGEISWARHFPSSFPGTYLQGNIGFGLNRHESNSGVIRIGTSSSSGIFLSSRIPAGKSFVIEPYLGFLGPIIIQEDDFGGYEKTAGTVGSLSLHYKFNRKNRP